MTVKITVEYSSVEAAIIALGKMVGVQATPRSAGVHETPAAPKGSGTPAHRPTEKRGRGRPRKSVAAPPARALVQPLEETATVSPPSSPVAAATTSEVALDNPAAQPPAAVTHTLEDCQKALEAVFQKQGLANAQSLLADFGATRIRDLQPPKFTAFIEAAKARVQA